MNTIVRRRRGARLNLGPYKRHELRGGRIDYPVQGYDGYGDGRSTNVADYISAEMRADWAANREMLMEVWMSGQPDADAFPDNCLPWLCSYVPPGSLPWACQHLD
jgi:hypothetical protein